MFYGHRSNFELFAYAGFVLPELEYDSILVSFSLASPKNDPKHGEKLQALRSANIPGDTFEVTLKRHEFSSMNRQSFSQTSLYQFVSVLCATPDIDHIINFIQIKLKLLTRMASVCSGEVVEGKSYQDRICIQLRREEVSVLECLYQDLERLKSTSTKDK
jgi:hypothetical protein